MESWYSIYEIGRMRHRELVLKYSNPHMVRVYAEKQRQRKAARSRFYRNVVAALGRRLETWGRVLQKKVQTC